MPKKKRIIGLVLVILGLLVVYGTHFGIKFMGITQTLVQAHANINIIAGIFITVGFLLVWVKR